MKDRLEDEEMPGDCFGARVGMESLNSRGTVICLFVLACVFAFAGGFCLIAARDVDNEHLDRYRFMAILLGIVSLVFFFHGWSVLCLRHLLLSIKRLERAVDELRSRGDAHEPDQRDGLKDI